MGGILILVALTGDYRARQQHSRKGLNTMSITDPVDDLVTALSGKMNVESTPVLDIIELNGDETYVLDSHTQMIRVLKGTAWITFNGEDRVVPQDEDTFIEARREQAIVSSLNHSGLVFEIQYL
jgi:hypothetical protein